MVSDIAAYLERIDVPSPIRARIDELMRLYDSVLTEPVVTVFLSDEIDEDGNRSFPSLWLLTRTAVYEAKISQDGGEEFDGTSLVGRLFHWVVRTSDFQLQEARDSSRMKLEIWFSDGLWGDFRATGENCRRLTEVLRTHLAPLLGRQQERTEAT